MFPIKHAVLFAAAALVLVGCTTSTDTGGGLELIQFLEAGQAGIARNTNLEFVFSAPVSPDQDLFERLKIQNVQTSPGQGNFSRAIGVYDVFGERVMFIPRYPEQPDRDDAGLYSNGSYHVFLKAGPDALEAVDGTRLAQQQEFLFDTSQYFEDPIPAEPPRAVGLFASDSVYASTSDISRLDPRPFQLSLMDSQDLLDGNRAIDPGAGGFPYDTPWEFDLTVSEPIDPQTITESNIELWEIRHNALGDNNTPPDGWFGELVHFKFPVRVTCMQRYDLDADRLVILIRVTPEGTLTDNCRYRLIFSGDILGIDFRNSFPGDNGLTGDGETDVNGAPFDEVGGLGYVTEFLIYNRDPVTKQFVLEYDPVQDGVYAEDGNTTNDPTFVNRVPYNPAAYPGNAVGLVPAFGDGRDGALAVGGGQTVQLHTGDTPNIDVGNPFTVNDLDYQDTYINTANPDFSSLEGPRQYQRLIPTEFWFTALTVSSSSILDITGVNPARIRVAGTAQVSGTIFAGGHPGEAGTAGYGASGSDKQGGAGGPGGYRGGDAKYGEGPGYYSQGSCTSFQFLLTQYPSLKAKFPYAVKGDGPGRGGQGGEAYVYYYYDTLNTGTNGVSGTGGGGGGHGEPGGIGEDRRNTAGSKGDLGPSCDQYMRYYNSSVKGLRGIGGIEYGDYEIADILAGGSGGGGGGPIHMPYNYTYMGRGSGGSGGGGAGALELLAAGPVVISGGTIDLTGGDGGKGVIVQLYQYTTPTNAATGAGGGGSGGALVLVSGDRIDIAGGILDTRGGAGGARANDGTTLSCSGCNGGGDGGKGRIMLMDANGEIDGILEGSEGDYPDYEYGKLAVRIFEPTRFDAITSTTRPFFVGTADPEYQELDGDTDIDGTLLDGQSIKISMASYQGDPNHPLIPDQDTESALIHVATAHYDSIQKFVVDVVPGAMSLLNTSGTPNRESFLRVHAEFDYVKGVQAATGPYALLDRVIITTRFNN